MSSAWMQMTEKSSAGQPNTRSLVSVNCPVEALEFFWLKNG